jgi:hypothetical protein
MEVIVVMICLEIPDDLLTLGSVKRGQKRR